MHNTPQQFARQLNRFFSTISGLIRSSQRTRQQHSEDWPEYALLETLVSRGLRGDDPRTKDLRYQLQDGVPYSFSVDSTIHHSSKTEPLTGADIALVVDLQVDGTTVTRRLVLVQLKRSAESGRCVSFPHIHHHSGSQYFGANIHQAQRMLLFTDYSVYWLSVTPDALTDSSFASAYLRNAAQDTSRHSTPLAVPLTLDYYRRTPYLRTQELRQLLEEMPAWDDRDWARHWSMTHAPSRRQEVPQPVPSDWRRAQREWIMELLLADLKNVLLLEATSSAGLRQTLPLAVCHAETVLAHSAMNTTIAGDLLGATIPFPQFLLVDVLAKGFGDDDPDLIDAMMSPTPTDYVKRRVRDYCDIRLGADAGPPVRSVVRVKVDGSSRGTNG